MTGRLLYAMTARVFHSVLNPPPEDIADECTPITSPTAGAIAEDHARFHGNALTLKST
jgi:hypothetical protein